MRRIALLALAALCLLCVHAQEPAPRLEFVFDLHVKLAEGIPVGNVPGGFSNIVPITGGTFEGPEIRGEIVGGGADYQLHNQEVSQIHAIYSVRTDDGVNILVDNQGVISKVDDKPYFYTSPCFKAPLDSKYSWLNKQIFVCKPVGGEGDINLRIWRVVDSEQ